MSNLVFKILYMLILLLDVCLVKTEAKVTFFFLLVELIFRYAERKVSTGGRHFRGQVLPHILLYKRSPGLF